MNGADSGLRERLKKTVAISQLGQGMDLGHLNKYAHQISIYLLLKVFYREINNNRQRKWRDLIEIVEQITAEMKLDCSREQLERLVDGILYSGDPKQQAPFSVPLFDEQEREFREYKFRYLIPDREASRWDQGGSTVYRLTESAQEIIFITREILEEFGFDLEQFYTLQLIKNGNFSDARSSVSNLIARVRNLIKKEKDWREDIIRNPALIFSAHRDGQKPSESELKEQFAEEKEVFADMFSWRDRLDTFPEAKKKEGELLFSELERARALHDRLAEIAISNLSRELEIRKNNPDVFWKTAQVSFKKDFWQDTVVNSGLPSMDLLTDLLSPLFSPEQDFIFPLDWAWSEQQSLQYSREEQVEEEIENEVQKPPEKEVDWDLLLELWEDVFWELLHQGQYSLSRLQELDWAERRKWLVQEKNLELFMMFIITDIKLIECKEVPGLDERIVLFNRLLERKKEFTSLVGKKITARLEKGRSRIRLGPEFEISPYRLYLEED
ncbi:MAG: hypothetical protein ACOCQ1_01115 [Halanaerobiaceae bacterium]